jgi:hypothetical protein
LVYPKSYAILGFLIFMALVLMSAWFIARGIFEDDIFAKCLLRFVGLAILTMVATFTVKIIREIRR